MNSRPYKEPSHGKLVDERELPRRIIDLSGGRTIAYVERGSGPPIILIHGTLVTLEDMWLGPSAALSRHFRVIAVDRPGHGRSQRPSPDQASPWRQAAAIHEAARLLGLVRPVVLGHSSGGAVALAYGMDFPDDTAGVVALAPICFAEPRLEQVLFGPRAVPFSGVPVSRLLNGSVDPLLLQVLWRAMFLPQAMPQCFADAFPFELAGHASQLSREGEDAAALGPGLVRSALRYSTCKVPVRILGGSADAVVNPWAHGLGAAQLIPDATFQLLPGIGHMIHHVRTETVLEVALSLAGAEAGLRHRRQA